MHFIFTNVDLLAYILSYLDYYEEFLSITRVIKDKRPLVRWLQNTKRYNRIVTDENFGFTSWRHFVNDKLQSENDKPAEINTYPYLMSELSIWYHCNKIHRYNLPAVVPYNGRGVYIWRKHGEQSRLNNLPTWVSTVWGKIDCEEYNDIRCTLPYKRVKYDTTNVKFGHYQSNTSLLKTAVFIKSIQVYTIISRNKLLDRDKYDLAVDIDADIYKKILTGKFSEL